MNTTEILGQKVHQLTLREALNIIEQTIRTKHKQLFFALNIHVLLQLNHEQEFKKKYEQHGIIFADGVPVVWLSKFTKNPLPGRVSGTDFVEHILQSKHNLFLIGSPKKNLVFLQKKHANIVGFFSPPFGSAWDKTVDTKIIQKINQVKPQIILVGVGTLKQEKWLLHHFQKLHSTYVGIGVGSAFEILSGEKPRAPLLFKNTGFEWLWRVCLEPKRLTFRYIRDFFSFVKLLLTYIRV